MIKREDDGKKGSFILYENNEKAGEMTYTWAGSDKFIIDHTDVSENFKGKGIGQQLVMESVAFAREKNVKIIPLCPFAKSRFDKDPGIRDVLA